MMHRLLLITGFIVFFLVDISAQDKHFTQFYASPLTLNPALTGAYNGRFRAYGIYRDQWRGVLESPYVTFAAAVDVRWEMELDSRYKDGFAVGFLFFNDKVGGIDFSTNQVGLSGAFHKGLDYDKKQFLSIGVQASLAQRNINYEDLTFDDQFNSIDAFSMGTRENLPENNFSYADFAVGLNYTYSPSNQTSFFAGAALHHFLQPDVSFYSDVEDAPESKLLMKVSGQFSAQFPINDRVQMIPRLLFAKQGPHLEFNTGTNFRIKFNDFNNNALHLGSWVRPVTNEEDKFFMDALIVMAGFEMGSVLFGLSYDINLDDATNFQQGQNALEFSVTYLGNFEEESIMCPKF